MCRRRFSAPRWKMQGKGRPLTRLAFDLDRSPQDMGEFLDDVEPQSHSTVGSCIGAVRLAESFKDRGE